MSSERARRVLSLAALAFGLWYFGGLAPYGLHVGEDGDLLYEAFAAYRNGGGYRVPGEFVVAAARAPFPQ